MLLEPLMASASSRLGCSLCPSTSARRQEAEAWGSTSPATPPYPTSDSSSPLGALHLCRAGETQASPCDTTPHPWGLRSEHKS